ncbi:MAG: AF1514 family protein [Thiobacillus sp.]
MNTLRLDTRELALDFNGALKLASVVAQQQLGDDTMLLSWYDRERDLESPAGVSECHEGCATKGSWDYALNRGARLAVEFDSGRVFFCFL